MVLMVVNGRRPIHVNGRQYKVGETFEVSSEVDAQYYRRRGVADNAPPPEPPRVAPTPPPRPQRVSPQPNPPPQPAPAPEAPKVSDAEVEALANGTATAKSETEYRRRDMRAED